MQKQPRHAWWRKGRVLSVAAAVALVTTVLGAQAQSGAKPAGAVTARMRLVGATRAAADAAAGRGAGQPLAHHPTPPVDEILPEGADGPGVVIHAPRVGDGLRPLVSVMHGMCGEPERECPLYEQAVGAKDWLLCPRASVRCEGGGSIWGWRDFEATVEGSVARAAARWPDLIDAEHRVLVGFSLGAIRAMDIAHRGGGRWQGVILIGAKVYPDARALRAAGVERLVLAAGEHDMMKWHMAGEAKKLVRRGYPAAFVSLGPVGHQYPPDFAPRFSRMLAWVRGDDSALTPSGPGEIVAAPR